LRKVAELIMETPANQKSARLCRGLSLVLARIQSEDADALLVRAVAGVVEKNLSIDRVECLLDAHFMNLRDSEALVSAILGEHEPLIELLRSVGAKLSSSSEVWTHLFNTHVAMAKYVVKYQPELLIHAGTRELRALASWQYVLRNTMLLRNSLSHLNEGLFCSPVAKFLNNLGLTVFDTEIVAKPIPLGSEALVYVEVRPRFEVVSAIGFNVVRGHWSVMAFKEAIMHAHGPFGLEDFDLLVNGTVMAGNKTLSFYGIGGGARLFAKSKI
jgi:hypothetical protein